MIIPMPMMIPVPDHSNDKRIRQLEQALILSLDMTQALMERLEAKLGQGFLGADLKRLLPTGTQADLEREATEIDRLIAEGQRPAAVKHFRENFAVTWDEAQEAVSTWTRHSKPDKLRSLKLARFIKSSNAQPDPSS